MLRGTVTKSSIDPERLAALIDGRLSGEDAALLRTQLESADDETLSAYADAVAVVSELDRDSRITIAHVPRRKRTSLWIGSAIAAGLAAILITRSVGDREPDAATAIHQFALGVPSEASAPGTPLWAPTRGGGEAAIGEPSGSFRVGVLLTDIEVALRHDAAAARPLLAELASSLTAPGSARTVARLRAMASGPAIPEADSTRALMSESTSLARMRDVRSAAWLEGLRLAANAGDVTYAYRPEAQAVLDGLSQGLSDAGTRALADGLGQSIKGRAATAASLERQVTELLRVLTR
jgi:hypothetical protein